MDGSHPVKSRFIRKNFTFPEDFTEKFAAIKKKHGMASDSEVLRAAINFLYSYELEPVHKVKAASEKALAKAAE